MHLPLYVEVAPGTAWLVATQCNGAPAARSSTIGVASGIANVCIGDMPANMGAFSCTQPATILNAGSPLVVTMAASLPAQVPANAATTLTFNGVAGDSDDFQTVSVAPGQTLAYALQGLSASLSKPGGLVISSSIGLLNSVL